MCSCHLNNVKAIQNYLPEIKTQKTNEDVNQKLTDQNLDHDDYILNGKSFNLSTPGNILHSKYPNKCQLEIQ